MTLMTLFNLNSLNHSYSLWTGALSAYSKNTFEIVMVFVITIGVFFLAWLAARFLAKRSMQPRRDGLMHMADRLMLGKDKQIVLLKVGQVYYLVGLSQNSIQFSQPVKPEAFADLFADKQKAGDLFYQKTEHPSDPDSDSNVPSEYQTQAEVDNSYETLSRQAQTITGQRSAEQFRQAETDNRFVKTRENQHDFSDSDLKQRRQSEYNRISLVDHVIYKLIDAFRWKSRWQAMKQKQPRQNGPFS